MMAIESSSSNISINVSGREEVLDVVVVVVMVLVEPGGVVAWVVMEVAVCERAERRRVRVTVMRRWDMLSLS